jgi:hypothetical protein
MEHSWSDVGSARGPDASTLRTHARNACPGRTAALVSARVVQLLGTADRRDADDMDADDMDGDDAQAAHAARTGEGLSDGERALLTVVELFIAAPHAIDDAQMGSFINSFNPADAMAILFHLALEDGFTKRRLLVGTEA